MKKRWCYMLHSGVALFVGACLYLLFRENTYLHAITTLTVAPFANLQFVGVDILRYYLPDFLWMYSLYCGLSGILSPTGRQWIIPAILAFITGVMWEIAQYVFWVKGTGDIADLVMYGAAIAVAIIIFRRNYYV